MGAAALGCGALVLGGMGVGGAAAAPNTVVKAHVKIVSYVFRPHSLTIAAGTKVVWKNLDSTSHDVKSTSGAAWGSPSVLVTGATYGHVFKKPGTYTYHCSIHPEMTGKVIVTG